MAAAAFPAEARLRIRGRRAHRALGDVDLTERLRAGDEAAFEAIYERYHSGLLAFCTHMLGSREEAEDVLQHVFVSAYQALRKSRGDMHLRAWLYTIARNRCMSELRTRRPHAAADGLDQLGVPVDGLPAEVQRRAALQEMVEDMQRLPAEQRAALVLFELGDHSHQEIAAVLGVRRDKVKALIFQAREGLLRARRARNMPCAEIRAEMASCGRRALQRSAVRSHVERCRGCEAYAADLRRQRAMLAAVLPVLPTAGLKSSVIESVLGGGVAAGGAGAAGGAALVAG
ncbi:MAG: hypothetical protein QOF04_284, partial [Solirubrobacteraceae bacterium]|nr:hypothetical protein [Solirubrobacteraceae bacterium]